MPPLSPALLAAAAVILIWGGSPIATKYGVSSIDPYSFGALRTVIGALIFSTLLLFRPIPLPKGNRAFASLAISAFSGFMGFPFLFTLGISLSSAIHGALILAGLPIFTGAIAALVERRRLSLQWWVGCTMALLGEVYLILSAAKGYGMAEASLAGDLILVLASVIVAGGYVAGARLTQSGYPALNVTFWGIGGASLALLPFLPFILPATDWQSVGWPAWSGLFYMAAPVSVLAYILWYWALAHGGITYIGLAQFFQPLVGVVLSIILLGEELTWPVGIASSLIFLGVLIAQYRLRGRAASR